MNLSLRLLLLAILAGAGYAGWQWLQDDAAAADSNATESASTPTPARRWQSSRDCRECHQRHWAEWQGSHHQIAYTNPEVRRLSDDFRQKECQACHLPRPVAQTGFGKRTLPRRTRPDEGVGCITCHLAADGTLMARRDNPEAPCRPKANADFASVKLCASCHNQHQTTDQYHASSYPGEGVSCNDCHMGNAGHRFPGAHDLAMLRSAGELKLQQVEATVEVRLTNVGAGHNFPTEERHRAVDISYRFVSTDPADGEWQRAYRFRQPYRDETGENTQLPARQTKLVKLEIPDGATRVQVRLWYRLNPYATDLDPASSLLEQQELALR